MSVADDAPQPTLVERLESLRERGLRGQAELRERVAQFEAKFADFVPPSPASARVVLDTRGFPTRVELESTGATADEIRTALIAAFLAARAERPTLPREAAEPLLAALRSADGGAPGHAAAHIRSEGVSVSDDLGQVTVTALFGDVTAIEADDTWLSQSRPEDVAADVLALAQRAATASDRFGRFTEEESDNG